VATATEAHARQNRAIERMPAPYICAWRGLWDRKNMQRDYATEDGDSRRNPMLVVVRSHRRTTYVLALLSIALLMALALLRE